MGKKTLIGCMFLMVIVATVLLLMNPKPAIAQQNSLRFGSAFAEATVLGYGPAQFMRIVEERTNGRIKFQRFWGVL